MNRVRAFFLEEATECLDAIRAGLDGPTDPGALYTAARRLRGNAQMARFGRLAEMAWSLEERLRPVARGQAPWDDALRERAERELASLARGVDAVRDGSMEQDRRESGMDDQKGNDPVGRDGVVPIDELEYRGTAALKRALALREPLEDAFVAAEPAGPIMDELFDLIRLGTK
jgi:chemotaxis protein histidine kinase CheA